jgi:branched-chain amino acid aminotransferase
VLWAYHRERLFSGAAQLYFEMPVLMTADWLQQEVLKVVKSNKAERLCRVRLQLYAAGGGLYSNATRHPSFVIECFPLEEDTLRLNENGLVVGVAEGIAKSNDSLSNLKSCNALVYAMGARQARANHWNDALICNTGGNVIESTIANVFWIKDGRVYTPPLTQGCVAGVMRRHLMQMITGVTEKPLTREALNGADEVFLTNAIKKIRWVGMIGDVRYGNEMAKTIATML